MNATERISHWLTESGWTKAELAQRAGISPSTMTRLLRGRSDRGEVRDYELGELVAMKLERATVQAWSLGQTSARPLRAIDLLGNGRAAA